MSEVATQPKKRVYQVWREVEGVKYPHEICYGMEHLERHIRYWGKATLDGVLNVKLSWMDINEQMAALGRTMCDALPFITMHRQRTFEINAKVVIVVRRIDDYGEEAI